jgi:hypothetical protein
MKGDGRTFSKNLCASLFNDDLLNEPNFGQTHIAGQYLLVRYILILRASDGASATLYNDRYFI